MPTPPAKPSAPSAPSPATAATPAPLPAVEAAVETEPVNSTGDAADDPAIWVDANDPAQARVIGTQKKGGLYVYGLDGRVIQFVPAGKLNNVDLRPAFPFAAGSAPIVVASDRDDQSIAVFRFDEAARQLDAAQIATLPSGFDEVYGVCLYHAPKTGTFDVIATSKAGRVRQWRLEPDAQQGVKASLLREFDLGSITEGCVADDEEGVLYLSQELVGLWRLNADGAAGGGGTLIGRAGDGNLTADVEGVAIYAQPEGKGYVIASSQGSSSYIAYDRATGAYVGSFAIKASASGTADAVTGTDGIEALNANLGPAWPGGIFIAQDDENTNPTAAQNFKLVPFAEIEKALIFKR